MGSEMEISSRSTSPLVGYHSTGSRLVVYITSTETRGDETWGGQTRQNRHATHPQCHQHHPYATLSSPLVTSSPHDQQMEKSWIRTQHSRQKRREGILKVEVLSKAARAAGAVDGKLNFSLACWSEVEQTPHTVSSASGVCGSLDSLEDVSSRLASWLKEREGGGNLKEVRRRSGLGLSGLGSKSS